MEQYLLNNPFILLILIFWVLPWKGVALWKSAQNSQKWWFISLFIFNTLAILPIIYIFYFSGKKKNKEVDENIKNPTPNL